MAVQDTEPYLPECLDSILEQSYENWELVAVNDHSTDRTWTILQEYAKKDLRIRVFNGSAYKLIPILKEAYTHVTGELVNRMDSDDRMPHNKLEILVNKWMEYGKGHVIAGGTQHFVDEGEVGDGFLRYEKWLNLIATNGLHKQEIYKECVIPSHSWIIHREDFEKVGGFDPVVYPEDYDLCFRFYAHDLVIIGIPDILHFWRDRSNRISRTWEEYKDNRYFDLKLSYFYKLDRQPERPLVVWGAGRNGKDLVKRILEYENYIHWTCDNPNKIGHNIYGQILRSKKILPELPDPQILVAVSSPDEAKMIRKELEGMGKKPISDFWFFL